MSGGRGGAVLPLLSEKGARWRTRLTDVWLSKMESKGGLLLKRKDYLGVDEEAGSHPNRTYYFKKNTDDLNKIVLTCTKTLHVSMLLYIYIVTESPLHTDIVE